MTIGDILLGGETDLEVLRGAVALATGVHLTQVVIARSTQEEISPSPVLCTVYPLLGEFPLHLCIYARDSLVGSNTLLVASKLAQVLRLSVLISDDSVNPYTWIMIDPRGNQASVCLDAEAYDEHEEFRIASKVWKLSPASAACRS